MAPSPATTKVSPAPTPVRRIALTQQPSGSVNEATASDIPSGTRKVTWRTFSAGPRTFWTAPAPTLGQHTDEVLRALGLSDSELADLRAKNVIGDTPLAPG